LTEYGYFWYNNFQESGEEGALKSLYIDKIKYPKNYACVFILSGLYEERIAISN
jgi:hypothetical protein